MDTPENNTEKNETTDTIQRSNSELVTSWLHNDKLDYANEKLNNDRVGILEKWLKDNNISIPWPIFLIEPKAQGEVKDFLGFMKTLNN